MWTLGVAIGAALLVGLIGRWWKNRDFVGLAFALAVIGLIWGGSMNAIIAFALRFGDGAPVAADEAAFIGAYAVLKLVGLPELLIGLLFVALAKPHPRDPKPRRDRERIEPH